MNIEEAIKNINIQIERAKKALESWESGLVKSGEGIATDDINVWKIKDTTEESILWAQQNCEALDLAIQALKAYKPIEITDEDVKEAINDVELWRFVAQTEGQEDDGKASLDLVIQALKQMKTEPCNLCHVWDKEKDCRFIYCPFCGRKLR